MAVRTLRTLQAARGLAALAVVIYHVGVEMGHDGRFWMATGYYKLFGPGELGVEFFFLLSGIVIVLAHWRDIGVPSSFGRYLWKRFRRIYPIYWVVLSSSVVALFALPRYQPAVDRSFLHLLSSFVLVRLDSLNPVLIVAWTLFHEILFYALFSLCLLNRRVGLTVIAIWLLGSSLPLFHLVQSPGLIWFFSPLHLLFGAGMLVALAIKKWPALDWRIFLIPGAAGLCAVLFWSYIVHLKTDAISLTFGVVCAFLLLGLVELERMRRLNVWPSLNLLGDASYALYLVHLPVLSIAFRMLYPAWQRFHGPLWMWGGLALAIAVAAGIALHLLIEVPLLRALPRFDARRSSSPADLPADVQRTS